MSDWSRDRHEWKRFVLESAIPGSALRLALVLDDYARDRAECFPSQETIAKRLDLSPKQVARAAEALRKIGAISTERKGVGRGNPIRYFLILTDAARLWLQERRLARGEGQAMPCGPAASGNPPKNVHRSVNKVDISGPEIPSRMSVSDLSEARNKTRAKPGPLIPYEREDRKGPLADWWLWLARATDVPLPEVQERLWTKRAGKWSYEFSANYPPKDGDPDETDLVMARRFLASRGIPVRDVIREAAPRPALGGRPEAASEDMAGEAIPDASQRCKVVPMLGSAGHGLRGAGGVSPFRDPRALDASGTVEERARCALPGGAATPQGSRLWPAGAVR